MCRWWGRLEQSKVRSIAKAPVALEPRHLIEQTQFDEPLYHLVGGYEGAVQALLDHADGYERLLNKGRITCGLFYVVSRSHNM